VVAAYEAEVEDLRATADALLAEYPPDVALERWMDRFIDYTATKRGMAAALDADVKAASSGRIRGAVETLRAAGVEAGVLRSDVDADDVRGMMGAVWQITDSERARRMLRVLMDGLRVKPS
jgi:hypothetical protein